MNEAFSAKITFIIKEFLCRGEHVRRGVYRCTWGKKLRTGTHTHAGQPQYDNNKIILSAEAQKYNHYNYTVLMQNNMKHMRSSGVIIRGVDKI